MSRSVFGWDVGFTLHPPIENAKSNEQWKNWLFRLVLEVLLPFVIGFIISYHRNPNYIASILESNNRVFCCSNENFISCFCSILHTMDSPWWKLDIHPPYCSMKCWPPQVFCKQIPTNFYFFSPASRRDGGSRNIKDWNPRNPPTACPIIRELFT